MTNKIITWIGVSCTCGAAVYYLFT